MKNDNELIAEFMGLKIGVDEYPWRPGCYEPLKPEHLAYHNNWSWLMPVVERINKLWMGCGGDGDLGYMCDQVILMHINESINRVHGAVVHFIKWYNNQPKP